MGVGVVIIGWHGHQEKTEIPEWGQGGLLNPEPRMVGIPEPGGETWVWDPC